MRKTTIVSGITLLALTFSNSLLAGTPPPPPPPPLGIPIDLGAAVILLIGAVLAGYRLYVKKATPTTK